jgi:hypothetical protein
LFFVLAALEVGVGIFVSVMSADVPRYGRVPQDAVFNYVATAILIAGFTLALRSLRSRIAAICLLLLFISIACFAIVNTAGKTPSVNLYLNLIAIVAAVRAIYAAFIFHARERKDAAPPREPAAPNSSLRALSWPSRSANPTALAYRRLFHSSQR